MRDIQLLAASVRCRPGFQRRPLRDTRPESQVKATQAPPELQPAAARDTQSVAQAVTVPPSLLVRADEVVE